MILFDNYIFVIQNRHRCHFRQTERGNPAGGEKGGTPSFRPHIDDRRKNGLTAQFQASVPVIGRAEKTDEKEDAKRKAWDAKCLNAGKNTLPIR